MKQMDVATRGMAALPGKLLLLLFRAFRRGVMILFLPLFKQHGQHFIFDPFGTYSYETISVGDNVFIGTGAYFAASLSGIIIGNHVMFAPRVSIIAGDHNTRFLGAFMAEVKRKLPGNDLPVTIEDDVWVGTDAIILKGVTLGR